MDEELERFKRDIKLHEYAASIGYELDKRESSRLELVMRKGDDKISVRKEPDGHYVTTRSGTNGTTGRSWT